MKRAADHTKADTEYVHWRGTKPEQRSYLVEVLHWMHYRPATLKKSWTKEEVLTWELLRCLEVLPQSIFLRPLLARIAKLSAEAEKAVAAIIDSPELRAFRYPSLGLKGSKRNCRSDIGLGTGDIPSIWLEAKTARFNAVTLRSQLVQQRSAMKGMGCPQPLALLTVLPSAAALPDFPNLSWGEVLAVFRQGSAHLIKQMPSSELRRGYEIIAAEFVNRLLTHPGGLCD